MRTSRRPQCRRAQLTTHNSQLTTRITPLARGFTLVELMLVLVILAILAGVVVQHFGGINKQAKVTAAKGDLVTFKDALSRFEIDTGQYPTTEEGLGVLSTKPGNLDTWKGPYIETVKKDPWGNDYIYRCPSNEGKDYDLLCGGPDGREGGGDDITP